MLRFRTNLLIPFLLAGLATPSIADVDAEIDRVAKVKGTLDGPGEVETFRFEATKGATLALTAVAKKKAPLDLILTLNRPSGPEIELSQAPVFKDLGKKVLVKKLDLPESGVYTLTVRANGTGEYQLKVAAVPRKKWTGTTAELGPDAGTEIQFGAPRGSRLTLKSKPGKGSPAVARWDSYGPIDLSAQGKLKPTAHIAKVDDSGDSLNVDAALFNRGTEAGAIAWTLIVKAPRLKPQKLDVRSSTIGSTQDGGTTVSRTVDAQNGGTVMVDDGDDALDGVEVVVPAGSLADDTRISIASADPLDPPNPETQTTVGPPIQLGPEGLTFSQPVDVWVPFDPTKLPAGVDPAQLTVLKVSASGGTTELPVLEVAGDRVRVQVTSFSTFVPFTPKGTPNLEGASFWNVFVELEATPDGAGMDSRERVMFLGLMSATFGAENAPGGFTLDLEDREYILRHDDSALGTVVQTTTTESESLKWRYGDTGQSIIVEEGPGDATEFQMNEDGTILVIDDGSHDEPFTAFDIMVRKAAQKPTLGSVAGKYWFAEVLIEASPTQTGSLFMDLARGFGELDLRADGSLSASGRGAESFFGPGDSGFTKELENFSSGGSFAIQDGGTYDGSVVVTLQSDDPGPPDILRMFPDSGNRILVGTDRDATGDEVLLLLAIRQSTGMKASDIAGAMRSVGLEFEPRQYDIQTMGGSVSVPDFAPFSTSESLTFDNGRIVTPGIFMHGWGRNDLVAGGVEVTNVQEGSEGPIPFTVQSTGRWFIGKSSKSEEVSGAFSPDGSFGFYSFSPDGPDDLFGLGFFFKQPPSTQ